MRSIRLILIAVVTLSYLQSVIAQQQNFINTTIWDALPLLGSKTYHTLLGQAKFNSIQSILQNNTANLTFFWPSEVAVQSAIKNNLLKNTTTADSLLYTILPKTYTTATVYGMSHRQYLDTMLNNYPPIVLSPSSADNKNVQVFSGGTVANIENYTECSNGIIYHVDQFVTTPLEVVDTISALPDLNQLENVIKSMNLSHVFTESANQTIFAPVDAAWNGSSIPFGTMVHDLKYQVVPYIYYQQDLLSKNTTLPTNYLHATVQTESFANGTIRLICGMGTINANGDIVSDGRVTVATVIRSDILTASGTVIHLIDKILPADDATAQTAKLAGKVRNGAAERAPHAATSISSSSSSASSSSSSCTSLPSYPSLVLYCILLVFAFWLSP